MNDERELLVEAAISAHRRADPSGELKFHPSFHDLDATGREVLFTETLRQRELERALARDGLSATARVVLRRIHAAP